VSARVNRPENDAKDCAQEVNLPYAHTILMNMALMLFPKVAF